MPPGQDQVFSLTSFIQLVKTCCVQSPVLGTESTTVNQTGEPDTNASRNNSLAEVGGAAKMCPTQSRVEASELRAWLLWAGSAHEASSEEEGRSEPAHSPGSSLTGPPPPGLEFWRMCPGQRTPAFGQWGGMLSPFPTINMQC